MRVKLGPIVTECIRKPGRASWASLMGSFVLGIVLDGAGESESEETRSITMEEFRGGCPALILLFLSFLNCVPVVSDVAVEVTPFVPGNSSLSVELLT